MIRLTRSVVKRWTSQLLHTHDTPRRTAAAFALGVFLGFSPFFGLHTVLAVVLAFVLGLNRVAALVGVYSNLPWFVAPYYTVTTVVGAYVLGVALPPQFGQQLARLFEQSVLSHAFWHGMAALLSPLLWPFVVGSTLGAAILAAVAYVVAVPAIEAGRRHVQLHHRSSRSSEGL